LRLPVAGSGAFDYSDVMPPIRKFIAQPKPNGDIRSEFERFLSKAREHGWVRLRVVFGFVWGNYDGANGRPEEIVSPDELEAKVAELEGRGDGAIGEDDLLVTVDEIGVRFIFCHDNDIHLEAEQADAFLDAERDRFLALGWRIYEGKTPSSKDG
jgi:hypothetical protein